MIARPHIEFAHQSWKDILQEGDLVIDATCGNGQDTLILAQLLQRHNAWGLIGLDIQAAAIHSTRALLQTHLSTNTLSHIHLFQQSHAQFPPLAHHHPIRLVVYNLGYLPRGNKTLTTQTGSTLISVQMALDLIMPGGMISITCYPGHEEGAKERRALLENLSHLNPSCWGTYHHLFSERETAPSLFLIQKKAE